MHTRVWELQLQFLAVQGVYGVGGKKCLEVLGAIQQSLLPGGKNTDLAVLTTSC